MISYIKGPLTAIEEDVIVVEAGGAWESMCRSPCWTVCRESAVR